MGLRAIGHGELLASKGGAVLVAQALELGEALLGSRARRVDVAVGQVGAAQT